MKVFYQLIQMMSLHNIPLYQTSSLGDQIHLSREIASAINKKWTLKLAQLLSTREGLKKFEKWRNFLLRVQSNHNPWWTFYFIFFGQKICCICILRLFPVMKNHLGKCYLSSTTLNWKFHETFFNPPHHTSRCSILQDKEVLSALTFSRTACLYSRFSVNCWILSNRGNGI